MDEQRLQAYQQLIQQLLSCPNGEESAILAANTELLDAGFLQVVVGIAGMFSQEGQENTANWLLGLASQLSEALDISLDGNTPEPETLVNEADIDTYLQFLLEVLKATAESEGNPQVVYPLLAANTDKLNLTFAKLLQAWATKTLEEAEPDTAEFLAGVIGELSNLIQQFPLGNKANNMEIAITGYEIYSTVFNRNSSPESWSAVKNNLGNAYSDRIRGDKAENLEMAIAAYSAALEVYTRTDFPQDWAMTQNNLGNAYRNRIRGDKAENLEMAIAAYSAALEVYTRTDFPQDWAMTQNNLGNAYRNRIRGDKAENLEYAIAAYSAALEVYTRTDFPQNWATTQNNLGNAYLNRIRGDKAENLEMAIAAYSAALEVYTRTDFPVDWAMTQNNLGNAYLDRIRGDKAENLEMAIAAYTQALEVRTRNDFPVDWAMTQNNLGNAYRDRIRGDKAENLEYAIAAYAQALEVYTRTDFPVNWAMTQNNLGAAYRNRIRGDKAENLEYAIAAYSAALEVRTRTDFPINWAGTQNNLGLAYSDRIRGDKAENLEYAIAAYAQALEVYTRTDFPEKWAMTQNNLGAAYSNRIRGDKAENLEMAITAFTAALKVTTRTDFPQENAETLFNLGIAYQDSQQFDLAYSTLADAIATVEDLRGEIISGEESKRKQAEKWNKLFRLMVEVCLALGRETEAITYIERSKTRNLVELISENIAFTPIQYPEIQNLLDDKTAIIEFYIFSDCFRVFIITRNNAKPEIWTSTEKDLEELQKWVGEYIESYVQNKAIWGFSLSDKLTELANILQLQEIITQIPSQYQKLIIIPHCYLHIIPFHAVPLSTNYEYLFDRFIGGVSYAPSCQLLKFAQTQVVNNSPIPNQNFSNLFAIQNPSNDLKFTNIEVETIVAKFQPQQTLKHQQATKSALFAQPIKDTFLNSQWLHFSCHGYFHFKEPLKSGLQLAGAKVSSDTTTQSSRYLRVDDQTTLDLTQCLTLEEIFELNLTKCHLVCLSACETGFTDIYNSSDEYISLSSGFIKAGASHIVSSLWAVSDFHTALLMIKFYEIIENDIYNVVLSLNNAQKWLNQATQKQIVEWISGYDKMEEQAKQEILGYLKYYQIDEKPFDQPAYWAAFCAISPVYKN